MHALVATAIYAWTSITMPGTALGQAFGLNDRGQTTVLSADGSTSGIWQAGVFTPLPAPPAGYTATAIGINDAGTITGNASTSTIAEEGFILVGSTYTFFARDGWTNTEARAIGNSGLVTGWSYNLDSTGNITDNAGFLYDPSSGTFSDVTPPNSNFTIVQGINKFGRITGSGRQSGLGNYAFVWQQQAIGSGARALVPFLDRFQIADVDFTKARGITDSGVMVGFANSGGATDGFVGSSTCGYEILIPPGGDAANASIACEGINNSNQVVCEVTVTNSDGSTTVTGFLGTPHGDVCSPH